ncbi:MAG: Gfo/Idh/MocA family protein [Opitutaceae bacterium]
MNWLVVGTGDVAQKRVFPSLTREPRSTIYGVVSRDPVKASRHAPRVWTDLAEAVKDPAIDAVYIATPVYLHLPQSAAASKAGKHVLCEKPAALDYEQAAEMVRAAGACQRLLGIAYFRRMYPKLKRAKELLGKNVIGRPLMAFAACSEWFQPGDGRDWLWDAERAGGGALYDIGSHRIDALNYLFGSPARVSAQLSGSRHRTAVENAATLLIEYPGGVRGIVDARWDSRVPLDEFRIVGSEGEMNLSPLNGPGLRYPGAEEQLPRDDNRHYPCIDNFVSAVLEGEPLVCSAADSLPTAWVLWEGIRHGC